MTGRKPPANPGSVANLSDQEKRELLRRLLAKQAGHPAEIDLAAEAHLDPDIRPQVPQSGGRPGRIFLTGATGYLGAFVLKELLDRTAATVYCLVRAHDATEGLARIEKNLARFGLWDERARPRLVAVVGDLAQPHLGLPPAELDRLGARVDLICHVGALVNFLFGYGELKAPNVQGTHEILRLACRGPLKPVHFVSSLSVLLSETYATELATEEAELAAGPELTRLMGYAQTKWVAERMLAEARRRGVPVSIYRPAFIGWHSRTGAYNPDDFIIRWVEGCLRLRASPKLNLVFNLAPVEYVSATIVKLALDPQASGKNFHLQNPRAPLWSEVLGMLGQLGYPLEEIPYAEWRMRLLDSTAETGPPLRLFAPLFPEDPAELRHSIFHLFSPQGMPFFGMKNVETLGRVDCPTIDTDTLAKLLERLGFPCAVQVDMYGDEPTVITRPGTPSEPAVPVAVPSPPAREAPAALPAVAAMPAVARPAPPSGLGAAGAFAPTPVSARQAPPPAAERPFLARVARGTAPAAPIGGSQAAKEQPAPARPLAPAGPTAAPDPWRAAHAELDSLKALLRDQHETLRALEARLSASERDVVECRRRVGEIEAGIAESEARIQRVERDILDRSGRIGGGGGRS